MESRDGKVVVRGNNGVSMASGLNWYLKHVCNCQVTWRSRQLNLPEQLPPVTVDGKPMKIRKVSPHKYRYYFNYCCFSYTLAYWDWSDWQRMIDLMALDGVNAPLAVTGQEAVWRNTGRRLGLSDKQMQQFFVGPGYLPFGWMGCIDGWAGPLPDSWIDQHLELQKKILARQRALGMTPILQGFTGHAPEGLKEIFPQAKIVKLTPWAGFPSTYFVDPNDPLFQTVGKTFIEEQTKLFGTNHLYASDTFIEMPPTSNDPKFLAAMGKAIYSSMATADPDAVWVLQGWIFYYCRDFWKPPQVQAFLKSVPQGKLLVLDLMCENYPTWSRTEAFCGQPWVWCILQNFGGVVSLHGRLDSMFIDLSKAMAQRGGKSGKLSGIGYIMEGLGWNPVIEAFQSEMAWCDEVPAVETWLDGFVRRRYGLSSTARKGTNTAARKGANTTARDAWHILHSNFYNNNKTDPVVVRLPSLNMGILPTDWRGVPWEKFLECAGELGHLDTYRFDLTNVSREILSRLASKYATEMRLAYAAKDRAALKAASDRMQGIIADLDRILAAHPQYLLGPWLERAKRWGNNEEERRHYEWNARKIITLWGGTVPENYANRQWAGMMKDYYARRWQLFYEALDRALEEKKEFDSAAFQRFIYKWQADWARKTNSYATTASGEDPVTISKAMFAKYKDQLIFKP